MEAIVKKIEKDFPCRKDIIKTLLDLLSNPEESYPPALFLHGHSGTGKTSILKRILRKLTKNKQLFAVLVNCVECYTAKVLFESVLDELVESASAELRCDTLKDFIEQLCMLGSFKDEVKGVLIAIDKAERLRDMDANILPSLLKLHEYTGLNVCVILLSQIPFEKFLCKTGLNEVIIVSFPQYTKAEALRILSADFDNVKDMLKNRLTTQISSHNQTDQLQRKLDIVDNIKLDFFSNYLNMCLSVFYKACRDVPELKLTARKCFVTYMEPVLDGSVDPTDVSRLWRHIAGPLKDLLSQVYMRFDQEQTAFSSAENISAGDVNPTVSKLAQSLELPYYAKYLLIAGFLASYNSAKSDKRLFVKHHGKQKKRLQTVNAKAKTIDKMSTSLGPKSFSIDRLLAIFYAILDEKVGLTCNLLSQISTLVHLKLLSFVSGESNIMDGSARLQCIVSLDFVVHIGKIVGFNVRQYLCDFM